MIKKLFFLVFILFCISANVYAAVDIVSIRDKDSKIFNLALEGFKAGVSYSIKEYILTEVPDKARFIQEIKDLAPKVIFTIGAKSSQIAKEELSFMPTVFTIVSNPAYYDLVGDNICGVRLEVSPKEQLAVLKSLKPQVKNVGIIYNPQVTKDFVDEAAKEAQALGINIISAEVESKKDVPDAIHRLENRIDAFWVITDPSVANSAVLESLLLFSLSSNIPLVCPARAFVEKGCLMGLDVDYKDIGAQAADIANSIIKSEKTAKGVGTIYPRKDKIIVNSKIAEKMKLSIPESIKSDSNAEVISPSN